MDINHCETIEEISESRRRILSLSKVSTIMRVNIFKFGESTMRFLEKNDGDIQIYMISFSPELR